ncbi:DnaJ domain-containing protein [Halocalculus aciditolerans]|uniref:J domain-containing protein n=1 Tax=Halocalculus aciditolerans TaxID=1383812 RepID=A0A830F7A2_9EURY|nr:DnaJ domain-containing protein [Halocalculus aciditolerans]GGL70195.1 hypothetical protein GCM10009039_30290 [Halocalculus aciditolerans]
MSDDFQWPAGFDRTPASDRKRYPGGFEVSRTTAFESILEELEKFDAVNVDVQTTVPHTARNPNVPYKDRDPDDPAVVVYFDRDGRRYAVPCDRWNNLRDNARAIAKYLDAKRAIERYGVATLETEMSTQALPSGDDDVVVAGDGRREPHEVLGVSPNAPESVVEAAARQLKKETHPDQPDGDEQAFKSVVRAEEVMLGE